MTAALSPAPRDLTWARRTVRQRFATPADLSEAIAVLDRDGDGLDVETARLLMDAMGLPPL